MRPLFVASAVVLLCASSAFAQVGRYQGSASSYGPYSRPALPPMLNLLRGGDPAANYYLGVVPERDRRVQSAQQGAAIQELEQRTGRRGAAGRDPDALPELPPTGHAAYFLNYSGYYQFGGAGRGSQTAPTPPKTQRRTR